MNQREHKAAAENLLAGQGASWNPDRDIARAHVHAILATIPDSPIYTNTTNAADVRH